MNIRRFWEIVSNYIRKEFDREPEYSKRYLKIKIKPYKMKTNTTFCNKKLPKESSDCVCLSVILINSVYRKDKKKLLSSSVFRRM